MTNTLNVSSDRLTVLTKQVRSSEHEIGTKGKFDCLAVVVYELEHFPGLNAVLLEILDVGVELGFVVVAELRAESANRESPDDGNHGRICGAVTACLNAEGSFEDCRREVVGAAHGFDACFGKGICEFGGIDASGTGAMWVNWTVR